MSDVQSRKSGRAPRRIDRRRMIAETARAACGATVLGLGLAALGRAAGGIPAAAIRPPGALAEDIFLSACLRCGLCVRDCPYRTLKSAGWGDAVAGGTPFFTAREIPCEMCEDIPCVVACPSGALDKGLTDIAKARMGVAVLVGHESCLNYLGLRCDVCYRVCPLIDQAITLELQHNPRTGKHAFLLPAVHSDRCTGCGKCEKSCVLEEAAIKVLPEAVATGRMGAHFRLGWEEKTRRGESLIPGVGDLPDRGADILPEPRP